MPSVKWQSFDVFKYISNVTLHQKWANTKFQLKEVCLVLNIQHMIKKYTVGQNSGNIACLVRSGCVGIMSRPTDNFIAARQH